LLNPARLTALLISISFAAGLNLYITIAALGLLARFDVLPLPAGLSVLAHTWVIALAVTLSLIEAIADKIPYVDLAWNAVHTFIRIPAAALLAYQASNTLSPAEHVLVTALAAGVAGIAHTAKTSARFAVSASPEPVSNTVLSTSEDIAAAAITWFATLHPFLGAAAITIALVFLILMIRRILTGVRRVIARIRKGPAASDRALPRTI
jgi:hypothetical protein